MAAALISTMSSSAPGTMPQAAARRPPTRAAQLAGIQVGGLRQRLGIDGGEIGVDPGVSSEQIACSTVVASAIEARLRILRLGAASSIAKSRRQRSDEASNGTLLRPAIKRPAQDDRLPPIGVR
jgi:hypothetical protein